MKLEAEGTSPGPPGKRPAGNLDGLPLTADSIGFPTLPANPWSVGLWRKRRPAWDRGPGTPTGPPPWPFATGASKPAGLLSTPSPKCRRPMKTVDPRRQRRALTEDELRRLLDVAHRRPLVDAMTIYTGQAKGRSNTPNFGRK